MTEHDPDVAAVPFPARRAMQQAIWSDTNAAAFETGRYAVSLTPEGRLVVGERMRGGGAA